MCKMQYQVHASYNLVCCTFKIYKILEHKALNIHVAIIPRSLPYSCCDHPDYPSRLWFINTICSHDMKLQMSILQNTTRSVLRSGATIGIWRDMYPNCSKVWGTWGTRTGIS